VENLREVFNIYYINQWLTKYVVIVKTDYLDDVTIVFRNELRMFLSVIMLFCNISH